MAPKKAAENPRQWKSVKFNGVTLRRTDLEYLNGPYFYNDRIVDYYLTFLDARLDSDTFLILPPSIALWIKHTPVENESFKIFLELLHLPRKNIILCPVINENKKVKSSREGGRHWSLLVFVKSKNAFMHFDSSKGNMNRSDAEQVYKVLRPYVSEPDAVTYIEYPKTPKQEKPCDCGVYILSFARIICDWYKKNEPKNNITDQKLWFPGFEEIKPPFISSMRRRVTSQFELLLNEKEPCTNSKNYKAASMTM